MPRRLQTKRDQRAADLWLHRYWWAAKVREPRVSMWDDSYDEHDPWYIDKTKVKRHPYVKFGYLHRVTTQQTTQLMEAMDSNGQWLLAQAPTPETRLYAENVTNWLEYQYRYQSPDLHLNNREQIERYANLGLKYGNGDLLVEWNPEWGACQARALDPYDVYRDASYGRWYIVRRVVTLAELYDCAAAINGPETEIQADPETGEPVEVPAEARDGGRALRAVRRVERAIRQGKSQPNYIYNPSDTEHGNSRRFTRGRVSGDGGAREQGGFDYSQDPYNAPIVVLECYEARGAQPLILKVIPSWDGVENLVFQRELNPYGICPVVPFVPHPCDLEFYGYGNCEISGRAARAIDYNLRAQLAIIGAAGWPPLFVNARSGLRAKQVANMYGQVIPVPSMAGGFDNVAQYMRPDISPAMHQMGQAVSEQAADFAIGENDLRRGNVGQARNATAAAVAESFGNITDKTLFRRWKAAMCQVGAVMLAIGRVHTDRKQKIPALGRHAGRFIDIFPELFDINWTVQFGGNPRGANASQMLAQQLNIAQSLGPTGEIDFREVARHCYRLIGERDPSRFLSRKDATPVLTPQEEEDRLLRMGHRPVISPQEDKFAHLQSHIQTGRQWAEELGPDDQRVKDLLEHTQITMAQWQREQQAAAGAAAGGNGGAAQFRPDQAGAPGQPMTHQPAVADVNQQRQQSNQAAAGQAPGGVVPGRQMGGVVSPRGPR